MGGGKGGGGDVVGIAVEEKKIKNEDLGGKGK